MRLLLCCVWCLFIVGTSAYAEPITRDCVTVPIEFLIAGSIDIWFEPGENYYLDVEAGQESAAFQANFTAVHSGPARLTGVLIPPPTAPPNLIWEWNFQTDGQNLVLPGNGTYDGRVKVHVKGITALTPAGEYSGGTMRICIDAL